MAKTPNITTRPTQALFWNIWGSRYPEALNLWLNGSIAMGTELMLLTEVTDTAFDATVPMVKTSTREAEPPSHLDGLGRIRNALPKGFKVAYEPGERRNWPCKVVPDVDIPDVGFGSALIYDASRIKPIAIGVEPILEHNVWEAHPRRLQWIVYRKGSVTYLVTHIHGVWFPENTKGDHSGRHDQSAQITLALARLKAQHEVDKIILGGDFNLDISTKALELLERGSLVSPPLRLRNLVREWDVPHTRTPQYRSYRDPNGSLFADYVLVGSNVAVHGFTVDNETLISDHAPLTVRFS